MARRPALRATQSAAALPAPSRSRAAALRLPPVPLRRAAAAGLPRTAAGSPSLPARLQAEMEGGHLLALEQGALAAQAPAIAGQRAVLLQHAVAGHGHRNGVVRA